MPENPRRMVRRSVVLLALLSALPVAGRADELADVRERVQASMQWARSYVVTTTSATGFSVTTTFVAPDRYRSALSYSGAMRDIVLIGDTAYVSDDGGRTYRKTPAPPEILAAQAQLHDVPVDRVLPDKLIGGKVWGRFTTVASGPQKDQYLICAYDKRTYRIHDCSNGGMTLTFSRYDDPANVVTVPPNVAGSSR